jgi:hypothetical protein
VSEAWLNFVVVIFIQVLFFIFLAYYQKKFSVAPHVLWQGAFIGFVFGLVLDHTVGKYLGLSSYVLGFGLFFLCLNALFSYGLFSATILLFQDVRPRLLFAWSSFIMVVYETANYFFPVWVWKLPVPPITFVIVLLVGYFGGALLVVTLARFFQKISLK